MSEVPLNLCLSISQDPLLQVLRPRALSSNHSPENALLTPCPTLPTEPAAIKRAQAAGDSKTEKEERAPYEGYERKMPFPVCSSKAELLRNTKHLRLRPYLWAAGPRSLSPEGGTKGHQVTCVSQDSDTTIPSPSF